MKGINLIIALLAAAVMSVSCNDAEPVFGSTPTERIQEELEKYQFALTARETWVMEYFPDSDLSYGGWIFVMQFQNNGKVRMWFEGSTFIGENPVTESDYAVEHGTGPMLKFRTHNDYLHWFSFAGGPNGSGYNAFEGDFEFSIMSVSSAYDEITLKGIRTGNTIRMYPLPADYTPEGFVQTVRQEQMNLSSVRMNLTANGQKVGVLTRNNVTTVTSFDRYASSKVWTLTYTYQQPLYDAGVPVLDESGNQILETVTVEDRLSAICLPGRIMKFYKPYEFKGDVIPYLMGETMQTFQWSLGLMSPMDCFVCTDSFMEIKLEQ